MEFEMDKLAYCGLYCEQCSCRAAVAEQDFRHVDPLPVKYRENRPDLSDYDCEGCKGRNLCGPCTIKDCASTRDIDHCGECQEFPCERLMAFANDGLQHHVWALENLRDIREKGVEAWFEIFKAALQCHCGRRKSWYCGCPTHP